MPCLISAAALGPCVARMRARAVCVRVRERYHRARSCVPACARERTRGLIAVDLLRGSASARRVLASYGCQTILRRSYELMRVCERYVCTHVHVRKDPRHVAGSLLSNALMPIRRDTPSALSALGPRSSRGRIERPRNLSSSLHPTSHA